MESFHIRKNEGIENPWIFADFFLISMSRDFEILTCKDLAVIGYTFWWEVRESEENKKVKTLTFVFFVIFGFPCLCMQMKSWKIVLKIIYVIISQPAHFQDNFSA